VTADFYCDEVLSGHTAVEIVIETPRILAFYHPQPVYPVHIIVIPRQHIASLIALESQDAPLLLEMLDIIKRIVLQIVEEHGACRVITNLGDYQETKHLHWHIISGERLQ
jgi:histidine triad (HIT) family protein